MTTPVDSMFDFTWQKCTREDKRFSPRLRLAKFARSKQQAFNAAAIHTTSHPLGIPSFCLAKGYISSQVWTNKQG